MHHRVTYYPIPIQKFSLDIERLIQQIDSWGKKNEFIKAMQSYNTAVTMAPLDINVYDTMIIAAMDCKKYAIAQGIHVQICNLEIATPTSHINFIEMIYKQASPNMQASLRAQLKTYAQSAYTYVLRSQIYPINRRIHEVMIQALDALGDPTGAWGIFTEQAIEDKNYKTWHTNNYVIYYNMLLAAAHHKLFAFGKQAFDAGLPLIPTNEIAVSFYEIMIQMAIDTNQIDYVKRLFNEIQEIQPNIRIFKKVISLGASHGLMQLAWEAYGLAIQIPEFREDECLHIQMMEVALQHNDLIAFNDVHQTLLDVYPIVPPKLTSVYQGLRKTYLGKIQQTVIDARLTGDLEPAKAAYQKALDQGLTCSKLDIAMILTAGLLADFQWAFIVFNMAKRRLEQNITSTDADETVDASLLYEAMIDAAVNNKPSLANTFLNEMLGLNIIEQKRKDELQTKYDQVFKTIRSTNPWNTEPTTSASSPRELWLMSPSKFGKGLSIFFTPTETGPSKEPLELIHTDTNEEVAIGPSIDFEDEVSSLTNN